MLGKAGMSVFGALQHAGFSIGPLHEPTIVPASIVGVFCAPALSWGAVSMLKQSPSCIRWKSGCGHRCNNRNASLAVGEGYLDRNPPCSCGTSRAKAELTLHREFVHIGFCLSGR